jgi:hypothetical protein
MAEAERLANQGSEVITSVNASAAELPLSRNSGANTGNPSVFRSTFKTLVTSFARSLGSTGRPQAACFSRA